jgi:hypothetical protein
MPIPFMRSLTIDTVFAFDQVQFDWYFHFHFHFHFSSQQCTNPSPTPIWQPCPAAARADCKVPADSIAKALMVVVRSRLCWAGYIGSGVVDVG